MNTKLLVTITIENKRISRTYHVPINVYSVIMDKVVNHAYRRFMKDTSSVSGEVSFVDITHEATS